MRILGLTGSIAMGKSTAAAMLRRLGVPVHDADVTVHGLLGGAALSGVRAAFPEAVVGGMVDRAALGARVFGDHAALRRLEGILHPLVRRAEQRFLRRAAARRALVVVLDVPLLFETGGEGRCDAVVLVTAPRFLQTQRVLRRSGMSLDKLNAIRMCQAPEAEKRRRADFVVPTGLGRRLTMQRLRRVLTVLSGRPARHWPPRPWPAVRGYRHA